MTEIPDTILEEREEIMVSATGDANPTLRIAHFLKPSSITRSVKDLPPLPPSSKSTSSDLKNLLHKVKFKRWLTPIESWKLWVQHLHPTYHSTWKEAGIYDAIMSTEKYQILRHTDLIVGVAENWCCETNTFIFPWGEATITLEDVMVLGGYSALGESVLSPLEIGELKETEERLLEAWRKIQSSTGQLPRTQTWIDYFNARKECEFEHEAFLSLWLSRYVFPSTNDKIIKSLFPLAILLARGTRVAIAPAILAGIYRDLGLLKNKIVHSNNIGTGGDKDDSTLCLCAPIYLVQLWVWERFPSLRPRPNLIKCGEPRLARWHKLTKVQVENVRLTIDTEGNYFQWRPYAMKNWSIPKFYRENEEWVLVDSDLDKELESIARCMRVSELVGFDCIEQYLPHRVAMQFGLDQDVPGCVFRCNKLPEIAWRNYNRPIRDAKLYIPGRLSESDVTTRYFNWWRQLMLAQQDAIRGVVRKPRISPRLAQNVKRLKKAEDSGDEDTLTIKELLQLTAKQQSTRSRPVGDVSHLLNRNYRTLSSCNTSTAMNKEEKQPMKAIEKTMQSDDKVKESEEAMEDIHRVEELLQLTENTPVGDVNTLLDSNYRNLSCCDTSTEVNKEEKLPEKSKDNNVYSEAVMKESEEAVENIHRVEELLQLNGKQHSTENTLVGDVNTFLDSNYQILASSDMSTDMNKEEKLPEKSIDNNVQSVAVMKESEEVVEDIHRVQELLTENHHIAETRPVCDVDHLLDSEFRTSSCNMRTVMTKEVMLPTNSIEENLQSEALGKESEAVVEEIKEDDLEVPVRDTMSQSQDNEVSSRHSMIEILGLELDARLNKLQELIAGLKAANRGKFEKKNRD